MGRVRETKAIKRDYLSNPINIEVVNTIVSSRKLIKNYGEDLSIEGQRIFPVGDA